MYEMVLIYAMAMILAVMALIRGIPTFDLRAKVRRGALTLRGVLGTTLGIMFMAYIYPEAITALESVNTTAWAFTGATGAAALWGLVALVAIAGFIGKVSEA